MMCTSLRSFLSASCPCESASAPVSGVDKEEVEGDDELLDALGQGNKEVLDRLPSVTAACVHLFRTFLRCMYTRRRVTCVSDDHGTQRQQTDLPHSSPEGHSPSSDADPYIGSKQTSSSVDSSSSFSVLPLSPSPQYFFQLAVAYAYSNGLLLFDPSPSPPFFSASSPVVETLTAEDLQESWVEKRRRRKEGELSLALPCTPHAAPFTLFPTPLPRHLFDRARRLAVPFNRLVDRLTCNPKLVLFLLRDVIQVDPFTRRLADICRRVYIQQKPPPGTTTTTRGKVSEGEEREEDVSFPRMKEGSSHFHHHQGGGEEDAEETGFLLRGADGVGASSFSPSFSSPSPPRNIVEDLRIHITRSDYMLDVAWGGADVSSSSSCLDGEEEEESAPPGRLREEEEEEAKEERKKAEEEEQQEEEEKAKEKEGRRRRVVDLKQVELNTIAASFGGLAGKVTKLHRSLVRSVLVSGAIRPECRRKIAKKLSSPPSSSSSLSSSSAYQTSSSSSEEEEEEKEKEVKEILKHLCPDNKPIRLMARCLALGHSFYTRRYVSQQAYSSREESKADREEEKEGEEEDNKDKKKLVFRLCPSSFSCRSALLPHHSVVVLFVCVEEETNEIDQRLLELELLKAHGIQVLRATTPMLVSMWKTRELALLTDEGTLASKDLLFDSEAVVPSGRLVVLSQRLEERKIASSPPLSSSSSSSSLSKLNGVEVVERENGSAPEAADVGFWADGASRPCGSGQSTVRRLGREREKSRQEKNEVVSCQFKEVEICGEVSVIYHRTFYSPDHYLNDEVWRLREILESSHAVKVPSIPAQLAGAKKIQEAFSDAGLPLHSFPEELDSPRLLGGREKRTDKSRVIKPASSREQASRSSEEAGGRAVDKEEEEEKKKEKRTRGRGGGEEEEEGDVGWNGEEKKTRGKKKFLWLLEYLLQADGTLSEEQEGEMWREVQSVFQLQVDPSEAFASSSSTGMESEGEEVAVKERRRRRAKRAVEDALRRRREGGKGSSAPSSSSLSSRLWSRAESETGSSTYILKPQREGGGNNFYGEEAESLLKTGDPAILKQFVLMKKMNSPAVPVLFVRADPCERSGRFKEEEEKEEEGADWRAKEEKEKERRMLDGGDEKKKKGRGAIEKDQGRLLRCTYSPGIQELGIFGVMVATGRRGRRAKEEGEEEATALKKRGDREATNHVKENGAISRREKEGEVQKEEGFDRGITTVDDDNSTIELINSCAGWMIRTKAAASREGGVAAGFGALDSPLVVDAPVFDSFLRIASRYAPPPVALH